MSGVRHGLNVWVGEERCMTETTDRNDFHFLVSVLLFITVLDFLFSFCHYP